jgi:hypothetical protein
MCSSTKEMLKDVGKGDGLICERGPRAVTFLEALGKWIARLKVFL